jgi:glycosyltransferase involved in cell wall biosynthesis
MYIPIEKVNCVGFISTRLAGTDGVSLETDKWAKVFTKNEKKCFYFAGELDRPPTACYRLDEAHFKHPEIREIFRESFGSNRRARSLTRRIHASRERLKDHLYAFIDKFKIDLLVSQNALTIPMNIPLGIALTEVIAETGIPTIAHHHDFFWERQRFKNNAVWDYLNMAFPPHIPPIRHVVINSSADNQLSLRTGISPIIIPNVMDFETPPSPPDEYAADVRQALGIQPDEFLILQPTRVVKRKGIEHAIELVKRLGRKAKLVISHASGDEGHDYELRLRDYSALLGVDTRFVSDIINDRRGKTPAGRKIYTLDDVYPYADFVTYPSNVEGFGNAFLEAVYYKKPIMVNQYSIYMFDIKPKGFQAVEIDGFISDDTVEQVRDILDNPELGQRMAEHNFQIAKRHFSFSVLEHKLMNLMI